MTNPKYITLSELSALIKANNVFEIQNILLHFQDRWNQLLPELKKTQEVTLLGLKLKGQKLVGVDLSDIVIKDSDFSDTDMSDSDLSNTVITGVNFSRSILSNSKLYSARISQTNMSHAKLYNINTSKIIMTGSVNLFEAYLKQENSEDYKTSPEITKRGFRIAEYMEEIIQSGEDDENNQSY